MSKYILNKDCQLRGWDKLPFAIYSNSLRKAFFYDKEQYDMILNFDGKKDIDVSMLNNRQKECFDELIKHNVVIEASDNSELLFNQLYKKYDCPYKEEVHWSITGRCNYKCKHCFMDAPIGAQGEPSFEDLCKELDAFERCGIKAVGITGGEPFVHPRFWDIIDECIKRDIRINVLYSNGLLVTKDVMEKLKEKQVFCSFQFSYDGLGWHDWLRGIPGAEKAVDKAFKLCQEYGAYTSASMVIHKHNVNTIVVSIKYLTSVGCYDLKINLASPSGAWANQSEHFLSKEEYFKAILDLIPKYYEMGAPLNIVVDGYFQAKKDTGEWSMSYVRNVLEQNAHITPVCACIKRNFYVSPKGIVMTCMPIAETKLEDKFPCMLDTPLENILNNSYYSTASNTSVKDFFERNSKCRNCDYRLQCCGGCRGKAAQIGYDNFYVEEKEICDFFLNGWKDKIQKIAQDSYNRFVSTDND